MHSSFWSDVAGLMKEEVDALAPGSGFSFADLAADRAGARLAGTVTGSAGGAGQVNDQLVGGASNVTISTTTIIIILLLVILLVIVLR